jgi:DNA-binding PadR family transcriptional regulator
VQVASDRDLAPGEWAVLALLCERDAHGWAIASQLTPHGELGAVWSMGRPLVYRSLEILEQRRLIEPAGRERGARGPNRTIFRATPDGHEALVRWLHEPVDRVRDVRSLLLLKLVFAGRLGVDTSEMLAAEYEAIASAAVALEERIECSRGTEEILLRYRLESTRAVLRFVEGTLAAAGTPIGAAV